MRWYWRHYLADGAATELVARPGLPPAYVLTCGFDPLRDEGRSHADALGAFGVPVTKAEYDGRSTGPSGSPRSSARPARHCTTSAPSFDST